MNSSWTVPTRFSTPYQVSCLELSALDFQPSGKCNFSGKGMLSAPELDHAVDKVKHFSEFGHILDNSSIHD